MRFAHLIALVVAALGIACACGGRSHPAATTTTSAPTASPTYVLVWNDGWLTDGAAATAGATTRARLSDDTSRAVGGVFVMRVVADHGDTLELENVSQDQRGQHCYGSLDALDTVLLHVTVVRADLSPVTVRDVPFAFPDATGGTVRTGVAVGPPQPRRDVATETLRVAIPLAEADVGFAYRPSLPLDADVEIEFGGPSIAKGAALRVGGAPVANKYAPYFTAQTTTADGVVVTLPDSCLSLRALTTPDALLPIDEEAGIDLSVVQNDPPPFEAHRGATIYWPDGRVAGTVVTATPFARKDGMDATATRPCFALPLRPAATMTAPDDDRLADPVIGPARDGVLRLCLDTEDVTESGY